MARFRDFFNRFSFFYAVCLFLAIYLVHHEDRWTIPILNGEHTIGLFFLAWVSTLRDLVQLAGARFKGIMIMLVVCSSMYLMFDSRIATYAAVALIWTELIDFGIFTILRRYVATWIGIVVSDVVSIPALWFLLAWFLGVPVTVLPDNTMVVEYIALALFYAIAAVYVLRQSEWRRVLNGQKERI